MSAVQGDLLLEAGDLTLVNGDLVIASGTDAVMQAIQQTLGFFEGEWFADEEVGLPYWDRILVKNPDLANIRELLRNAILGAPGVASVPRLELSLDGTTRHLTIAFVATMDDGSLVTSDSLQIGAP